jgi:hypothetical protein
MEPLSTITTIAEIGEVIGLAIKAYKKRRLLSTFLGSNQFLREEPLFLVEFYKEEQTLMHECIPYKELVSWLSPKGWDETLDNSDSLQIQKLPLAFGLTADSHELKAFQSEALDAFRNSGRMKVDNKIIRLSAIDETGKKLFVQKAFYSDQAQSNLVLDWPGPHTLKKRKSIDSLRTYIDGQYHSVLPSFDDTRLANTIGVSAVLFFKSETGCWLPYLPLRARGGMSKKKRLALAEGQFSATASGSAEWDDNATTFEHLFTADMYRELSQEARVPKDSITHLIPVSLCREFQRGGKPQLFYVGFTSMSEDELTNARRLSIQEEAHIPDRKVEVEDEHLDFSQPNRMRRQIKKHGLGPEAAANLSYANLLLQQYLTAQ